MNFPYQQVRERFFVGRRKIWNYIQRYRLSSPVLHFQSIPLHFEQQVFPFHQKKVHRYFPQRYPPYTETKPVKTIEDASNKAINFFFSIFQPPLKSSMIRMLLTCCRCHLLPYCFMAIFYQSRGLFARGKFGI